MGLTEREKRFVAGGVLLLTILLTFSFAINPRLDRAKTLRRVLVQKEGSLQELQIMCEEHAALQDLVMDMRSRIAGQQEGPSLLSFLEQIASECGLRENVVHIRPVTSLLDNTYVETSAEVRLESITLEQVIRFILRIHFSKRSTGITALHIRRSTKTSSMLDATVKAVRLALPQDAQAS